MAELGVKGGVIKHELDCDYRDNLSDIGREEDGYRWVNSIPNQMSCFGG